MIPEDLVLCSRCGEYFGRVPSSQLSNDRGDDFIWDVHCACSGRPCERCGRWAHKPGSNIYHPETNEVLHLFYLGWTHGVRCRRCR